MVKTKFSIIKHFLDTDLYKLTMCYAIMQCFPKAYVRYTFVDRNKTVYPKGFVKALREEIKKLEKVKITDEEVAFLREKCYYLPEWFTVFLQGFNFNSDFVECAQDKEGHLSLTIEGPWYETVLYEVMILAIISELYHTMNGDLDKINLDYYYDLSFTKANNMLTEGLTVSEFGTRRRFSFETEEMAVKAFKDVSEWNLYGKFPGTSNVYLAMKYNLTPIGTMAHEFVAGIAGLYGPQQANKIAMEMWSKAFDGALGIFLYDTYGFDAFADNLTEKYARCFNGVRVDSGNEKEQLTKIIDLYKKFGIDPTTKQIVFSNALDTDKAIELHKAVGYKMIDSYGIGTHLSADGSQCDIKPCNFVIKLVAIKKDKNSTWNDTCKMSEDKGKYTGKPECVETFKKLLGKNE